MFPYVIINHDSKQQAIDLIEDDLATYSLDLNLSLFETEVTNGEANYWAEPLHLMPRQVDLLNTLDCIHYSGKHETFQSTLDAANLTIVS